MLGWPPVTQAPHRPSQMLSFAMEGYLSCLRPHGSEVEAGDCVHESQNCLMRSVSRCGVTLVCARRCVAICGSRACVSVCVSVHMGGGLGPPDVLS